VAQELVGREAKRELLSELDASFAEFMVFIEGERPSPTPAATWGEREVLAHIVGWHRSSASRLLDISRGAGDAGPPSGSADEVNQRFVSASAGLSRRELLVQVKDSFEAMRSAVQAVPEGRFRKGAVPDEHSPAYFVLWANGPDHYAEHLEHLRPK
jgi:hypothetical protein